MAITHRVDTQQAGALEVHLTRASGCSWRRLRWMRDPWRRIARLRMGLKPALGRPELTASTTRYHATDAFCSKSRDNGRPQLSGHGCRCRTRQMQPIRSRVPCVPIYPTLASNPGRRRLNPAQFVLSGPSVRLEDLMTAWHERQLWRRRFVSRD
jgi:hypothetical protein